MGVPLTPGELVIMNGEIHDIFASRSRREWEQRLTEADVCAIPLLQPGEVFDAPQTMLNGTEHRVFDLGHHAVVHGLGRVEHLTRLE